MWVLKIVEGNNFSNHFFFDFQVYYERVNSYSASATFAHAYCGFKDVSRNLILDSCGPITKIRFSKGFAFSNIEAASGETFKCIKIDNIHRNFHIAIPVGSFRATFIRNIKHGELCMASLGHLRTTKSHIKPLH